jgi:Zn-dependent M28 family amino/carboxypeptidase
VTRDLASRLLAAGGLSSLAELQAKLDDERAYVSAPIGLRVSGNVAFKTESLAARNVIGVLPGTGPHADEYVVIGGHYDHLGVRRDQIYNGADDNASGTAGVIESCRALAALPYRDRGVLCMAFSGEERGLLGSEHYCENPTIPLESITAMINMDMIGRLDHNSQENMLGIQGLGTGLSFQQIVDHRTAQAGIQYLPDASAKGPSDHASFYEVGVPSLFFFTGVHEDYHQPGDDTEKVNAAGGAQVTELVYAIAHDLINSEEAPVYAQVDQRARIMRGAAGPGGGVVLGVMPDFEDESGAKGWRIAQVFPGGGAA